MNWWFKFVNVKLRAFRVQNATPKLAGANLILANSEVQQPDW